MMVTETTDNSTGSAITSQVVTQVAGLDRQLLAKIVPQANGGRGPEIGNLPAVALQIEWERKEALEAVEQELANLSPIPSEIMNKIAALSTTQDILRIRGLKSEIQQDISKEITQRQQEADQTNAGLALSAERAELVKALHQYDVDSKAAREQMRKDGYGDADNEAKLKALQSELDKEQEGSPRWLQIRDKMLELDEEYFKKVKNQAHQNGDAATEKNASECANKAWEMRKEIADARNNGKEKEKGKEETLQFQEKGLRLDEGDEPSTAAKNSARKLPMADANHNEIHTPSGAKDRNAHKNSAAIT